jgi:hypothetical protein
MNTLNSFFVLLALIAFTNAFAPAVFSQKRIIALNMGLFDGGAKKKEVKNDPFSGKGKRITVREDEDAAMYIVSSMTVFVNFSSIHPLPTDEET